MFCNIFTHRMFRKSGFKSLSSSNAKSPILKKVMIRKIRHEIKLHRKRKQPPSLLQSNNSIRLRDENEDIGVLWKIVPVWISASKYFTKQQKVNMVIDEGSSHSLMDSKLAQEIGFKGQRMEMKRKSICENDPILCESCSYGRIYAKPVGKTDVYCIDVCTVGNLSKSTTPISPNKLKMKFTSLKKVDLLQPAIGSSRILLGFDHQHLIRVLWSYPTLPHEPYCAEYLWGPAVLYHPQSARKAMELPRSNESFV